MYWTWERDFSVLHLAGKSPFFICFSVFLFHFFFFLLFMIMNAFLAEMWGLINDLRKKGTSVPRLPHRSGTWSIPSSKSLFFSAFFCYWTQWRLLLTILITRVGMILIYHVPMKDSWSGNMLIWIQLIFFSR